MEHYSKSNEVETLQYNGKEYHMKFYQGYLFGTVALADDIIGQDDGLPINDDAEKIDENVAYYFDEDDFYGYSGKELFDRYINDIN